MGLLKDAFDIGLVIHDKLQEPEQPKVQVSHTETEGVGTERRVEVVTVDGEVFTGTITNLRTAHSVDVTLDNGRVLEGLTEGCPGFKFLP